MTTDQLLHIIEQGESETIEFKTSYSKEVIESVIAFSNTKGGRVIIGVKDNKKIVGMTISDESTQNWINQIKQNTTPQVIPDVDIFDIDNKIVVLFNVIEYPVKPVAFRNKYFKRVANSNHLMSVDEIVNEHLKTINSSWDFYPDPNHALIHISEEKVKTFIKNIEERNQTKIKLSPIEFLSKFEMIRGEKLTFGAYLLFANDYCSISDVQVGRFKSDITIIDSITLNTDLFTEVNEIISFVKKHLMVEYIITGEPQRQERFDYPLDAIREIVINMVVHRDYRDSNGSIIKIYDDRIEFYNPGKLFGNITIDDLLSNNYNSQSRNKLISKAFKEVGIIERYGTGIRRILDICKDYGIVPPIFEEAFNGFKVSLFKEKFDIANPKNDKVTNKVTNKVTDKVTDNQRKIIESINKNSEITTNQLADEVGISQRKIKENINKLKEKGILQRIGPAKGGYWKIIAKE